MPVREPHYDQSRKIDTKIKDRLQHLRDLTLNLRDLYINGASSDAVKITAADIEADLAELRQWIDDYDSAEGK